MLSTIFDVKQLNQKDHEDSSGNMEFLVQFVSLFSYEY
jgi:hypothetical protein